MSHLDVGSTSLRERSSSSHIAPTRVKRWNEGVRNSQQLWRELCEQGSTVSAKTVSRFVGQLRKDSGTARSFKQVAEATVYAWTGEQKRSLTARQTARLLVSREETLREWQKEARRLLGETDPEIAMATRHVHSFLQMRATIAREPIRWLAR